MSKLIAITGATGAQGGGLVRAILDDPEGGFTPRAITRNPDSDAARTLAARGVEVVQADLDDEASLVRAFAGAHGAFCVTNFWEHLSAGREAAQAANLARAAHSAEVTHAIWSTLEDVRRYVALDDDRIPTLEGGYKLPHFDAKGASDGLFSSLIPTTLLRTSFYWENFISFGMGPTRDADGRLVISLPLGTARLPSISAADIGPCALGILRGGDLWTDRTVGIAGGHLTGADFATGFTDALGEPVHYEPMSLADYRALDMPIAAELANMFQFKVEFAEEYGAARSIATARELHPGLLSFTDWLQEHVAEVPVPA